MGKSSQGAPYDFSGHKKAGALQAAGFFKQLIRGRALILVDGVVDRFARIGDVAAGAFDGFTGRQEEAKGQKKRKKAHHKPLM
jgi:hypothetical protein